MHEAADHAHVEGSKRTFFFVWGWLLAITGLEVVLAYQHLAIKLMLTLLMMLSIVKATLIISYFMHLAYERRSLAWTLMPALVFVVGMMFIVFPDSLRALLMRAH
ncbi:MAG TPA: cytochrome C oxidase subunit IV family protein [Terriglobia bacterium]|nr:cytochrome C oxidase subunit IV family protein [Terriglobia bacterium]